jgi:O-antigen/teichoic acid export membrane protein
MINQFFSSKINMESGNYSGIFSTGLVNLINKVITFFTLVITTPILLNYLGTERFGLWMTVSSLIMVLNFIDFGINNSLITHIAHAYSKQDFVTARKLINTAWYVLCTLSLIIMTLNIVLIQYIPWGKLYTTQNQTLNTEFQQVIVVFIGLVILNIVPSMTSKVQLGLQQGQIAGVWQLLANISILPCIIMTIALHGTLLHLTLSLMLPLLLSQVINTFLFFYKNPELRPTITPPSISDSKNLLKNSTLFFILQLSSALSFAADNIIIASSISIDAVSEYAITDRVFSIIAIPSGLLLMPLWPSYSAAFASGDKQWAFKTLKTSLQITIIAASTMSLILLIFYSDITTYWLNHTPQTPLLCLIGFALWKVVEASGNAIAMLLNGANIIKAQVIISIVFMTTTLTVKLTIGYKFGINGIIWSTLIIYSTVVIIPYIATLRKIFTTQHIKYLKS